MHALGSGPLAIEGALTCGSPIVLRADAADSPEYSCNRRPPPMHAPESDHPALQIVWLLILPIPIACIAWTVTHEDVFSELRNYCESRSKRCRTLIQRKF